MPDTSQNKTEVGGYFVSNYPPYSRWQPQYVPRAIEAMNQPPRTQDPLGLYLHIPFCRKRCTFCYYKVYTDKNAAEINRYLDALIRENEIYSRTRALEGRQLRFAYFGGGTPSYISEKQLRYLVDGLNRHVRWDKAEEVTFADPPRASPGRPLPPRILRARPLNRIQSRANRTTAGLTVDLAVIGRDGG